MTKLIYQFIYGLPFHTTLTLLALLYVFWHELPKTYIGKYMRQRHLEKPLCYAAFLGWLILMSYITIFSREKGEATLSLMPFHQLRLALNGETIEILRSAWMNVLLFVPGGLLFSALLPRRWPLWIKAALTIIALICVSVSVEYLQWHFQLGQAETDDVLCNFSGVCLGLFISMDHSAHL